MPRAARAPIRGVVVGSLSYLASPTVTREVLADHGLAAKYSLGQNFLVNDTILQKIVELSSLDSHDRVLEVGPGIGTLTIALLKNAEHVTSIERDPDLPAVLAETLAPWADSFTLIKKDALDLTLDDLDAGAMPNKLVANLPYAVAATVVLDYFERIESIESATVMVQKEVADRMAAEPGTKNYGAYTVKLRLYAEPAGRFLVGPNNFFPPPRVDSSVIRLNRRPVTDDEGEVADAKTLSAACMMADAAFASRRKTLSNSCKTYFASRGSTYGAVAANLPELFERSGIDPKRRGETLELAEFIRMGQVLLELEGA